MKNGNKKNEKIKYRVVENCFDYNGNSTSLCGKFRHKSVFYTTKMSAKMIGIEIFGCGGKIAIDGFII